MNSEMKPVVARKMAISRSYATNEPLPALDWPNVIRTISELRQWYIHSGDDTTAEALAAITLLFEVLDEHNPPTVLVETMLDRIGKLAYAWTTMPDLTPSLRRRVHMVLTAAIHDLDAFEEQVNLTLHTQLQDPN